MLWVRKQQKCQLDNAIWTVELLAWMVHKTGQAVLQSRTTQVCYWPLKGKHMLVYWKNIVCTCLQLPLEALILLK